MKRKGVVLDTNMGSTVLVVVDSEAECVAETCTVQCPPLKEFVALLRVITRSHVGAL